MAGATIWPIPKAISLHAHQYPRHWKRNMFFLYGGMAILAFQFSRFAHLCRVSSFNHSNYFLIGTMLIHEYSNQQYGRVSTWTGAAMMLQRESDTNEMENRGNR